MLLYRQIFLNILIFLVTLIPVIFIDRIFYLLGQDPEISKLAAQFVWYVTPGAFFQIMFTTISEYASGMRIEGLRKTGNIAGTLTHIAMMQCFSMIEWGWTGVCVATSL